MLPLLPALILLLLQGPANVERMAGSGQLPGALQALHRQMASASSETSKAEEVVFASLLAVSGDKDMSRALLHLLTFIEPPEAERPILVSTEESSPPTPIPPLLGAPQDGYFDCRRSRDGPAGSLWIA